MGYKQTPLECLFDVTHIAEISYRGIPSAKSNDPYMHNDNFWSMYYVDKGNVSFETQEGGVTLKSGQSVFFPPQCIHRLASTPDDVIYLICVAFQCEPLDRKYFANNIFVLTSFERNIISNLISFSKQNLERHSNLPDGPKGMKIKASAPSYAAAYIKASIEYLLLTLYQRKDHTFVESKRARHQASLTVNSAIEFMSLNLAKNLTLDEIAAHVQMSSSRFRTLFKSETHQSVIDYYNDLKIEQAKVLIRNNNYSYNEIAALLGYNSESYFSKQFKQKTGMSPSEFSFLVNHEPHKKQ